VVMPTAWPRPTHLTSHQPRRSKAEPHWMYVWIWRRLPGPAALRMFQVMLLLAAVSALLLFLVFPWLELNLPPNPITGPGTVGQ
jgi:hypothetical protein